MPTDQLATIFARPRMPITSFHAMSQEPLPFVPDAMTTLLPPGLTLLTGPMRCGKTSLTLQLMQAVATGERLFGTDLRFQTTQGRVLYLGLQHTTVELYRLQYHLAQSYPQTLVPGTLECTNSWAPLTPEEGLRDLEQWLTVHAEECRLLVIDNLEVLRTLFRGKDRDLLALLRRFAEYKRISILLLHTCKASSPLIDYAQHHLRLKPVSLSGYCQLEVNPSSLHPETFLLHASRERLGFRLLDTEEMLGLNTLSAHKVLSRERLEVLRLFHERSGPLSPAEVAEALGYNSVNARQLLHGMVRVRLLSSPSYGSYEIHPDMRVFLPRLIEQVREQEAQAAAVEAEATVVEAESATNSGATIVHTVSVHDQPTAALQAPMPAEEATERAKPLHNRSQRRQQKFKKRH